MADERDEFAFFDFEIEAIDDHDRLAFPGGGRIRFDEALNGEVRRAHATTPIGFVWKPGIDTGRLGDTFARFSADDCSK